MVRAIPIYSAGRCLTFVAPTPDADPWAIVLTAKPFRRDASLVTLRPRRGPGTCGPFTAAGLLVAAQRRWFRLRVYREPKTKPRRRRCRRRSA